MRLGRSVKGVVKWLVEWGMWLNPLSGSINNAVIHKRKKMDRTLLFPSVFIIICSVCNCQQT